MSLCHRLWQGRRCMKADPVELLTCCVWLTWSNLSNLCLCPQEWIAFQFPFFPRLTVISCWLNPSACLAVECSLQREEGESVPTYKPPVLLHTLGHKGEYFWAAQPGMPEVCSFCHLYMGVCSSGVPAGWWGRYISSESKQNLGCCFKNTLKTSVPILLPFVAHDKTDVSKSPASVDQTIPASVTWKLTVFSQLLNRLYVHGNCSTHAPTSILDCAFNTAPVLSAPEDNFICQWVHKIRGHSSNKQSEERKKKEKKKSQLQE